MEHFPTAIGGVGGSGTRVVAELLEALGCQIGNDLNRARDNLLFTLLFKRQEVLEASDDEMRRLWSIFVRGMVGPGRFGPDDRLLLKELSARDRCQHTSDWLATRVERLLELAPVDQRDVWWGWKEPNTHVVIERLAKIDIKLKYIHVVRNGLDMAFSGNQSQRKFWDESSVGIAPEHDPGLALEYWYSVHRRMTEFADQMEERFLFIKFDRLCSDTEQEIQRLAEFTGVHVSGERVRALSSLIRTPTTIGRFRKHDLETFNPQHVEFVSHMGFDTHLDESER